MPPNVKGVNGAYVNLSKDELINLLIRRDREIARLKGLNDLASRDELTNVYNRNVGFDLINKKLTRGNNIVICLLDMNNLKKINDIYGHIEGDNSIRLMVETIEDNIKKTDFLVRIGGDEFLIVFHNLTLVEAKRTVERARNDLKRKKLNHNIPITFSAGFIDCNKHQGKTIKELIDKADKSMYKNKKAMKAKYSIENYR